MSWYLSQINHTLTLAETCNRVHVVAPFLPSFDNFPLGSVV
jgi:hypothetical protein